MISAASAAPHAPVPHIAPSDQLNRDPLRVPPPPPPPSQPTLESLLGQALTLHLRDGRTFLGYLLCVDKGVNIILRDAEEFKSPFPPGITSQADYDALGEEEQLKWEELRRNKDEYWPRSEPFGGWGTGWGGRAMGMVGVKGEDVVKIEIDKGTWKALGGEVTPSEGEQGCLDSRIR